jgi:hypothetical protein
MTSLAAWITKNAEARIHFAERVITLKPYTREAVLFGLTHGWLSLSDNGKFQTAINKRDVDGFIRKLEGEAKECTKKAFLVGQWLASAGSAQTVMSLWGIRP